MTYVDFDPQILLIWKEKFYSEHIFFYIRNINFCDRKTSGNEELFFFSVFTIVKKYFINTERQHTKNKNENETLIDQKFFFLLMIYPRKFVDWRRF